MEVLENSILCSGLSLWDGVSRILKWPSTSLPILKPLHISLIINRIKYIILSTYKYPSNHSSTNISFD